MRDKELKGNSFGAKALVVLVIQKEHVVISILHNYMERLRLEVSHYHHSPILTQAAGVVGTPLKFVPKG